MNAELRRLRILILKETRQLLRDKLSLTIGLILPIVMIVIFGYGISMDIKDIRLGVVAHENSTEINDLLGRFKGSRYFSFEGVFHDTDTAGRALIAHRCEACLYLPQDYARRLKDGDLTLYLVVTTPNIVRARMVENYVQGVVAGIGGAGDGSGIRIQSRMWFNDSNNSRYYLLPGVVVMVMTMIGALLTSLVMAREYERGNFEAIFITPMRTGEALFAKALINFMLGMVGLTIILISARYVFEVPLRGNILILASGSALYLLVALGIGLVISSVTKNQFVACQLTLILTFMPAMILSGFLYEINNMPAVLQWVTLLVPGRYYVEFLQTVFLAGDIWPIVLKDMAVLGSFALIFLTIATKKNPKSLE